MRFTQKNPYELKSMLQTQKGIIMNFSWRKCLERTENIVSQYYSQPARK
jgi:hypothetical protein